QHESPGSDMLHATRPPHLESDDLGLRANQNAMRLRLVEHVDAGGLRELELAIGESAPAAVSLDREVAIENGAVADSVRLSTDREHPAQTLALHPGHRRIRLADQGVDQCGIGVTFGDLLQ